LKALLENGPKSVCAVADGIVVDSTVNEGAVKLGKFGDTVNPDHDVLKQFSAISPMVQEYGVRPTKVAVDDLINPFEEAAVRLMIADPEKLPICIPIVTSDGNLFKEGPVYLLAMLLLQYVREKRSTHS
jgi:hypothetical protein